MGQMAAPGASAGARAALSGQSPQDVADNRHSGGFDPSYRPPQVHPRMLGRGTSMGPPAARMPPTARAGSKQQAARAGSADASGDLKRRAVKRAAGLYADSEERQQVSALPLVLDLLGAIGGGLRDPLSPRHKPVVDLLERVLLRGGMLDELTALASLYHASLTRCLVRWCRADHSGQLVVRFRCVEDSVVVTAI